MLPLWSYPPPPCPFILCQYTSHTGGCQDLPIIEPGLLVPGPVDVLMPLPEATYALPELRTTLTVLHHLAPPFRLRGAPVVVRNFAVLAMAVGSGHEDTVTFLCEPSGNTGQLPLAQAALDTGDSPEWGKREATEIGYMTHEDIYIIKNPAVR